MMKDTGMMKKIWSYLSIFIIGVLIGMIILLVWDRNHDKKGLETTADSQIEYDAEQSEQPQNTTAGNDSLETGTETESDATPAEDKSAEAETPAEDEQAEATVSVQGNYTEWNSGSVYNGGDEVVFNNKIYKAKWWTQNEEPGTSDVWEDTLATPTVIEPSEEDDGDIKIVNTDVIADEDFKAVVYYPSWKEGQTGKIKYDIVTHVNYAFAIPQSDGTLRELEASGTAKKIIEEAHANGRKVLLAVGGWSYNDTPLEPTFMSATETTEKVQKFGDAIVDMCNQYGFDGIDIDWEHPRVDGTSSKQYESLMLYLADKLHAQDKLLTSAVLSGVTPDGNVYYDSAAHTDAVLNAVDWINIMAYDGGDGERHSSYDFAVNSGNYWLKTRGMDKSKVVLGVPFYGRPSWAAYADILAADGNAYAKDIADINGMEAHYNGVKTMQAKTSYAVANFGGIMVWEITQDTTDKEHSLLEAIGEIIYK